MSGSVDPNLSTPQMKEQLGAPAESAQTDIVRQWGHTWKRTTGTRDRTKVMARAGNAFLRTISRGSWGGEAPTEPLTRHDYKKAAATIGRGAVGVLLAPLNLSKSFRQWAWKGTDTATTYTRASFAEEQRLEAQQQEEFAAQGYNPGDRASIAAFLNRQMDTGTADLVDELSGHILYFDHARGSFLFAEKNSEGRPIVRTARVIAVEVHENGKPKPLKGQDLIKWGRSFALAYSDMKKNCPEKLENLTGKQLDEHVNNYVNNLKENREDMRAEQLIFAHMNGRNPHPSADEWAMINKYLARKGMRDELGVPPTLAGEALILAELQRYQATRNTADAHVPAAQINGEAFDFSQYLQNMGVIDDGQILADATQKKMQAFLKKRTKQVAGSTPHLETDERPALRTLRNWSSARKADSDNATRDPNLAECVTLGEYLGRMGVTDGSGIDPADMELVNKVADFVEERAGFINDVNDEMLKVCRNRHGIIFDDPEKIPQVIEAFDNEIQRANNLIYPLGGRDFVTQQQILYLLDQQRPQPNLIFADVSGTAGGDLASVTKYLKAVGVVPADMQGDITGITDANIDQAKLQGHLTSLRNQYGEQNDVGLAGALGRERAEANRARPEDLHGEWRTDMQRHQALQRLWSITSGEKTFAEAKAHWEKDLQIEMRLAGRGEASDADMTAYLKRHGLVHPTHQGEVNDPADAAQVNLPKLQEHLRRINPNTHTLITAHQEAIASDHFTRDVERALRDLGVEHEGIDTVEFKEPRNPIEEAFVKNCQRAVNKFVEEELGASDAKEAKGVNSLFKERIGELDDLLNGGLTEREIHSRMFKKGVKRAEPLAYVLDVENGTFRVLMDVEISKKTGTYKRNPFDCTVGLEMKLSKSTKKDIQKWWKKGEVSAKRDLYSKRKAGA
ncbi:MAG: hypothetical protein H7A36_01255 [Chlamydiales bacterium]|nr:hypothetical protein [Chlamydiales bacterium]